MQKFSAFVFVLLSLSVSSQTYKLTVLQNQNYQELDSNDYSISHYSPYFGNVTIKPDMYFGSFAKLYDLYDGVFTPLKQGYSYFINAQNSTTIYAAKGDFVQRPGDTSVYSFKTYQGANRRFVQQWSNMGIKNGSAADYINFQLCLFENSGIIEIRFGPNSVSNGLWEAAANGPTIGLLEMDETFNTIYKQLWLQGDPSNPAISTANTLVNLSSTPAPGTVYRFVPGYDISISEEKKIKVDLFPNPAFERAFLRCEGEFSWDIATMEGRILLSGSGLNSCELDLEELGAGFYFISVYNQSGSAIKKLLRQ